MQINYRDFTCLNDFMFSCRQKSVITVICIPMEYEVIPLCIIVHVYTQVDHCVHNSYPLLDG